MNHFKRSARWLYRPVQYMAGSFLLLYFAFFALLQWPNVQKKVIDIGLHLLHRKTPYTLHYESFQWKDLKNIKVYGLHLQGANQETLCQIGTLQMVVAWGWLPFLQLPMIQDVCIGNAQFYSKKALDGQLNMATLYHDCVVSSGGRERGYTIEKVKLHTVDFYYASQGKSKVLNNLDATIEHFSISPNLYTGTITDLSYRHTSFFPIVLKHAKGKYILKPDQLSLQQCHLETKCSSLSGDFCIEAMENSSLFPFNTNHQFRAIISESRLDGTELSCISPIFSPQMGKMQLKGEYVYTSSQLTWSDARIVVGRLDSHIEGSGSISMGGAGHSIDMQIAQGSLYPQDLIDHWPQAHPLPSYMKPITVLHLLDLSCRGTMQAATIQGEIQTNVGHIKTDLTLTNATSSCKNIHYGGTIDVHQLALANWLPNLPIDYVSAVLSIHGQGISGSSAKLSVVATDAKVQSRSYSYKQISASVQFNQNIIDFGFKSGDPNLQLDITGYYPLYHPSKLRLQGKVDHCDLKIFPQWNQQHGSPVQAKGEFALNCSHFQGKQPQGQLDIAWLSITHKNDTSTFKEIAFSLFKDGLDQVCNMRTPYVDAKIAGNFTIKRLISHIKSWMVQLRNPTASHSSNHTSTKEPLHINYTITYKANFPFQRLFGREVYLPSGTLFLGHFDYHMGYEFSLQMPLKSTIQIDQLCLKSSQVNLLIRNIDDIASRLVELSFTSGQQIWTQKYETEHLSLHACLSQNNITMTHEIAMPKYNSHLHFSCIGFLLNDAMHIDLLPSTCTINRQTWEIQAKQTSILSPNLIKIGDISIRNGQGLIYVAGELGNQATSKPLKGIIEQLDISMFSFLPRSVVQGSLNAHFLVKNEQNALHISADTLVQGLSFKGHPMGNLSLALNWDRQQQAMDICGKLIDGNREALQLDGHYYPYKNKDQCMVHTVFRQMDLSLLNAWAKPVFSTIAGQLTGDFTVTGTLAEPILNGMGQISHARAQIDYLNVLYQIQGAIYVHDNALTFKNVYVYDDQKGHGKLHGSLLLGKGFPIHLVGQIEALRILEKEYQQDEQFYGTIFATGTMKLHGPIQDLTLEAKATMNRGNLAIVADHKIDIESIDTLVTFIDAGASKKGANKIDNPIIPASKFKLMADVTILPSVNTSVLFGSHMGQDRLKGSGYGMIHLEIGTHHNPYIMGNYIFDKGSLSISVYNLIEKEFLIQPKSQLTFNGYYQETMVDLKATYQNMVSTQGFAKHGLESNISVEILLTAQRTLGHPEISYRFTFPEKTVDAQLRPKLDECCAKALVDKNYRNTQILSLLINKKIYHSDHIMGLEFIAHRIDDLVSKHLQSWLSSFDPHLEVEANVAISQLREASQSELFKKAKIKFTYSMLLDRLKISTTLGSSSHLINDWALLWKMSSSGNISSRIYSLPVNKHTLLGASFLCSKNFGR